MIFKIIREVHNPFCDSIEEQWWLESQDFKNIKEIVNNLKINNFQNDYKFENINEKNNTANFIITNRDRYKGDDFTISPFNLKNEF